MVESTAQDLLDRVCSEIWLKHHSHGSAQIHRIRRYFFSQDKPHPAEAASRYDALKGPWGRTLSQSNCGIDRRGGLLIPKPNRACLKII